MSDNDTGSVSQGSQLNSEWEAELAELHQRNRMAEAMGGSEGIERQHQLGRLTVRERIAQLLDHDSFHEVGKLTGKATYDEAGHLVEVVPTNIIIGKGRVDHRKVVVHGDDFTIRGGSSESTISDKWLFAERLACDLSVPLVRLVDASGGSIRLLEMNQATKIPGYGYAQGRRPDLLGMVPVVSIAMGPCAGLAAVQVVASHFSVMVKETAQVFAAGPHVVAPGIGEHIDKEDLGGFRVHARGSGVVDNEAESESDALKQARRFLQFLPSNVYQSPPRRPCSDSVDRRDERLASSVPHDRRKPYRMRDILAAVFDQDSLFEIGRYQGASTITMLGRLNGYSVAVMANDPLVRGGAMTAGAAEKITRFVDLCDTFHLPVVNFVDQPGVDIGKVAEERGTIRKAVRAAYAISQVRVPWSTVFVRRSFGVAGAAYGPFGPANIRYAWPSAYWGSIPIAGGVEAAYRRDIASAPDPKARRDELVAYYSRFESPFRTAERFGIEEVIDPRDTRGLLCEWVEEAYDIIPQNLGPRCRTMRM